MEITGWDQNTVDISGTKYASSQDLLNAIKIEVSNGGNAVQARSLRPGGMHMGSLGAKYVIRAPRRTTFDSIGSSNGSIRVEDVEGETRLPTSNGPIDLQLDSPRNNDIVAKTSNGSLTLRMPDGAGAALHAAISSTGTIRSDFEILTHGQLSRSHIDGTIGSGGPRIDLITSNGNIRVLKI